MSRTSDHRQKPVPAQPFRHQSALLPLLILGSMCYYHSSKAQPLSWTDCPGGRVARLAAPPTKPPGFHKMENVGVSFTNALPPERLLENSMRFNGCGVAAGDVDGDGLCDLFFCSLDGRSHLYRNLGNWRFVEITEEAGVACAGLYTSGATFADVDGDGDLDLLVNSYGKGTRLFLNDGHGHFTEKTDAGLLPRYGSTSLTLADIDGDGTLDLYVANYATTTMADHPGTKLTFRNVGGKPTLQAIDGVPTNNDPDLQNRYQLDPTTGKLRQAGEPDVLYLNKGNGVFEAQSWTGGRFLDVQGKPLTSAPYDWGLSALLRDFNGDGAPDLYVCNDLFSPDRFWINDGQGHFRAASNFTVRHTSHSSMGIDAADINRDGIDDFLVLDMLSRSTARRKVHVVGVHEETFPPGQIDNRPQCDRNTLFLGRGDGTYAEIAYLAGLEASEWSWMPVFLDVDLDGYEDVLITTGYFRDSLNADLTAEFGREKAGKRLTEREVLELQHQVFPLNPQPKVAFRNRGDLTFEDVSQRWGFNEVGIAQGMCVADLDNDGDLDVIINNFGGTPSFYRNESSAPRVAVRLKGLAPNTRGIGAKIVFRGGPVVQSQQMVCGGRFLSSDDTERVFAVGKTNGPLTLEVSWRSGRFSLISNVEPNCVYEIDESQASTGKRASASPTTPLFRDVSELLNHAHAERPYDDLANQPLLPHKLSEAGPGVAWADVDGNGWPDLLVGGGRGGNLAVLLNDGQGHFRSAECPAEVSRLQSEQAAVVVIPNQTGAVVFVAQSNYELQSSNSVQVLKSDGQGLHFQLGLSPTLSCPGPMALADVHGNGTLELFVGGRLVPGKYPAPGSSDLYQAERAGNWTLEKESAPVLNNLGLVNSAVFSDLDGDGFPDLILACGWGAIHICKNDHGRLIPWNPPLTFTASSLNPHPSTLDEMTGWWNGVTTGDFDGDGRMDIVVSNWGRNSKYERHRSTPIRIYYGDWNGSGAIELLEAFSDPELQKMVPVKGFDSVRKALPWVQGRFKTYGEYSRASVQELLGEHFANSNMLEVNTVESMVLLNRGDHFEVRPLPIEAQVAPGFGICAADFDGDGNEDVFLAQNFYATDTETSRYDAGRGLLMRGDGQGNLSAMPGQTSGIEVYGDQRGAAFCDYDGDGRTDLVVTQNGTTTKLYHNELAKPGLRVRLAGPAGNPSGIGARMRLRYAGSEGPVREIHAGSGYWSQDDATQVLARKNGPAELWVRWPGGKTVSHPVPPSAREVTLSITGEMVTK